MGFPCPSRQNGRSRKRDLAVNRRNGPRLRRPVRPGAARTRRPGKAYEWLREGTVRGFRGGRGAKIKNIPSKATKCMKTLDELTKCHDKRAKKRRKLGLLDGHLCQSETSFARNCWFRKGIRSDYGLRSGGRLPSRRSDRLSAHLQDSYLRRMWRLANTLAKVREGILEKKMLKRDVRSRNV